MQTVQGHAKRPREILPLVRTFCFDHFTVENQIDTSIKITAIRRPLPVAAFLEITNL